MAKTAQMEQQDRIHAWEQSTTRQEILAAARRVVERDGVFEASLTSVAREANFAPTSVYAYFTNKNDLLQAVVADDLTVLTRAMRDAADNKSEDAKAPEAGRSSEQLPLYSLPPRPQLLAIAESRRDPESAKLKEPSSDAVDTIAQLQQTVAKLEIRPVDAWLERRLREFERALAALEERHKKRAGRDGETSEDVVQESVRDLRERLDQLEGPQRDLIEGKLRGIVERMDGSEQRLRQSVHDMQGEMAQVGRRLTALENAAFAASPEFFQRIPAHPTAQIPPPPEPPALKLVTGEKTDEQETADPVSDSYLAAARRSAQAATEHKEVHIGDAAPLSLLRKWTEGRSGTLLAAGGAIVFVLMLLGANLFLHENATKDEASIPMAARHVAALTGKTRTHVAAAKPSPAVPAALSHLETLANAGNAKAELLIGLDYLDANGVARNEPRAAQWLARAAAHGEPVAQYRLGTLYQDGRGLRTDPVAAFNWYQAAALQGNRKAMHSLAVAYAEGWGTPKNFSEAARWFERAAQFGFTNSQFNLGVLYERGMGVRQSLLDAYKWYALAAAQGDQESKSRIAALKTQLSPADIAVVEQEVAAFTPETPDMAVNYIPKLSELPSG